MKTILLVALTFLSTTPAFAAPVCTGSIRLHEKNERKEVVLVQTYQSADQTKWEADLGPIFFSATYDQAGDDYLLMITKGPAYTDGVAVRGSLNRNKQVKASFVSATETYQIVCQQ